MTDQKILLKRIWGIVLVMTGIGVFFRIPQVMPRLESMQNLSSVLGFIKFCFYLLGALLVGGGVQRIRGSLQQTTNKTLETSEENQMNNTGNKHAD
jgi:hypothetical protein